jgi:hypothetical protein
MWPARSAASSTGLKVVFNARDQLLLDVDDGSGGVPDENGEVPRPGGGGVTQTGDDRQSMVIQSVQHPGSGGVAGGECDLRQHGELDAG